MTNLLHIKANDTCLEVILNATENYFSFKGESRPENPKMFFEPIFRWIMSYENQLKHTTNKPPLMKLVFGLEYFNSSSAKYIFLFIEEFRQISLRYNTPLHVEWEYDKDDDDMLHAGQEFMKILKLEFAFVLKKNE